MSAPSGFVRFELLPEGIKVDQHLERVEPLDMIVIGQNIAMIGLQLAEHGLKAAGRETMQMVLKHELREIDAGGEIGGNDNDGM